MGVHTSVGITIDHNFHGRRNGSLVRRYINVDFIFLPLHMHTIKAADGVGVGGALASQISIMYTSEILALFSICCWK